MRQPLPFLQRADWLGAGAGVGVVDGLGVGDASGVGEASDVGDSPVVEAVDGVGKPRSSGCPAGRVMKAAGSAANATGRTFPWSLDATGVGVQLGGLGAAVPAAAGCPGEGVAHQNRGHRHDGDRQHHARGA
ncbi:hypothetical protein [Streptomyces yangpuensis]|uniref:hypothetical protein n=1 Tax=Streptomyces yangpuensis TaxID=1648182 RepID=UPI0036655416